MSYRDTVIGMYEEAFMSADYEDMDEYVSALADGIGLAVAPLPKERHEETLAGIFAEIRGRVAARAELMAGRKAGRNEG
jgi:hypothetical protein